MRLMSLIASLAHGQSVGSGKETAGWEVQLGLRAI